MPPITPRDPSAFLPPPHPDQGCRQPWARSEYQLRLQAFDGWNISGGILLLRNAYDGWLQRVERASESRQLLDGHSDRRHPVPAPDGWRSVAC